MDRHSTWHVLSQRAQGQVDAAARTLAHAQQAVDRVELTRQKLHRLLQDCLLEQTASRSHALALGDRRNALLFIAQLQAMDDGMQQTLQAAQAERDHARAHLAQAHVEAHKARHLLEQAARTRRDALSRQEQSRLDEWTTMRHGQARTRPQPQPQRGASATATTPGQTPADAASLNTPAASPPR
jgi:flagellar export protein FliJ